MKNLKIPEISDKDINLSQITEDYSGIIIGYKDKIPVGIIQYDNCNWFFFKSICLEGEYECDTSLYNLIMHLLQKQYCSSFKVLEFNK